jgi:cyclopropane fatty-acyl-phospholipid synthase-like methyltransferase
MELVQRVEFIKKACTGKKVLHLGCTNWPYTQDAIDKNMLLHFELAAVANSLYGFDFDQEGLDVLAASGTTDLYRADLEKLEAVDLDETFDVIVAGEMIEHLNNPGLFLKGIQRFMNADTELVITTINAYSALRFAIYGLRGKQGLNEPVHPDHVAYYSYKTLTLLIERAGLTVSQFCFYDIGTDHRQFQPWYYNLVNDVAVTISPQLSDGVIAVCQLGNGVKGD